MQERLIELATQARRRHAFCELLPDGVRLSYRWGANAVIHSVSHTISWTEIESFKVPDVMFRSIISDLKTQITKRKRRAA